MSESDDDDWFTKDIHEFDIPHYQPAGTSNATENLDIELKLEDKLKFMNLNNLEYDGNYFSNTSGNSSIQQATTTGLQDIKSYLENNDSVEVLCRILNGLPKGRWVALFSFSSMNKEFIKLSLRLVCLICGLPFPKSKAFLLDEIFNRSTYWDQIGCAFQNMIDVAIRKKLEITQFWQEKFHSDFTAEMFWKCLTQIQLTASDKATHHGINALSASLEKLNYIPANQKSKNLKPENSSIFPSLSQLIGPPIILSAQTTSPTNVNDYLTRNLWILKQDFLLPIRKEILNYRQNCAAKKPHRFCNIQVYIKVQIRLTSNESENGNDSLFIVDLDPGSIDKSRSSRWYSNHQWNQSKAFMTGSLLFFTSSLEFTDLIVAVVGSRSSDILKKGFVSIEIKMIEGNCNKILDTDLLMFESEIFFQPYYNVFNALQQLNDDNFPLKKYIIDSDVTIRRYPDYISNSKLVIYNHKYYKFDVKSNNWPTKAQLKLNESQYTAIRAGLTNKFCIIQGPCGTGKTYIGLEIVSAILANTDKQILIVCYTNHALDQFLMKLLRFTKSIIRLGGQSKNETLDMFNVKNLENPKEMDCLSHYLSELKKKRQQLLVKFRDLQKSGCEEFQDILEIQEQMASISQQIDEYKQISTYFQIRNSKKRIIGMTSTCAARFSPMLNALQISIVLVEEAAQLLESHVIAALTQHTEHLIMIGDHQQLRPINSEHSFKELFNIDVSLMERLINAGFSYARLNVQHRMRPEIANLIRPHIFDDLTDDDSVLNFLDIKGMSQNLFFVTHKSRENDMDDEITKSNQYEAKFLVALCNYLLQQGYKTHEITILCTYNGQKLLLSKLANDNPLLTNVKILTVDNYQGEENKIILLSLVRSNNQRSIGFLGIPNRICVALSRAREGFYIIGNMDFLAENSGLWTKIKNVLEKQSAIGTSLGLKCAKHQTETQVLTHYETLKCIFLQTLVLFSQISSIDDYKFVKYGGCSKACKEILSCKHVCSHQCHTELIDHVSECRCKR